MYDALQYAIQQANLPEPAPAVYDEITGFSSSPESNSAESSHPEQEDDRDLDFIPEDM
jgi:hypothetical protein